eukprot:3024677-Heterocapsa_arctica.AAC.1
MRHRARKEPGSWMSPSKAHRMVPRYPSTGQQRAAPQQKVQEILTNLRVIRRISATQEWKAAVGASPHLTRLRSRGWNVRLMAAQAQARAGRIAPWARTPKTPTA